MCLVNLNCSLLQVYIIDAKNFSKEPVAKLKLPQRVPYGYHGIYLYKWNQGCRWYNFVLK